MTEAAYLCSYFRWSLADVWVVAAADFGALRPSTSRNRFNQNCIPIHLGTRRKSQKRAETRYLPDGAALTSGSSTLNVNNTAGLTPDSWHMTDRAQSHQLAHLAVWIKTSARMIQINVNCWRSSFWERARQSALHFYDDGAVGVSRCSRCWCFRGSRRVSVSSFIAIRCISSEGRRKESAIVILSRSISLFRAFELMALNLRKSLPRWWRRDRQGRSSRSFHFFTREAPIKSKNFTELRRWRVQHHKFHYESVFWAVSNYKFNFKMGLIEARYLYDVLKGGTVLFCL